MNHAGALSPTTSNFHNEADYQLGDDSTQAQAERSIRYLKAPRGLYGWRDRKGPETCADRRAPVKRLCGSCTAGWPPTAPCHRARKGKTPECQQSRSCAKVHPESDLLRRWRGLATSASSQQGQHMSNDGTRGLLRTKKVPCCRTLREATSPVSQGSAPFTSMACLSFAPAASIIANLAAKRIVRALFRCDLPRQVRALAAGRIVDAGQCFFALQV